MTISTYSTRSQSLRLDGDDIFSSPDPLAASINDENSFPRSSPVKGASPPPRRHRRTKVLEDITLSSPQKARTRSIQPSKSPARYQSDQFLSPWKIRVTVEAEAEEAGFDQVKAISNTTVMPLHDDSSPSKESQGRRRINSGSRKPHGDRRTTGSPARCVRKRSGASLSRLIDLDTAYLDDEKIQIKPKRKSTNRKSGKASGMTRASAGLGCVGSIAKPGKDSEALHSLSTNGGNNTGIGSGADSETVLVEAGKSPKLRELDFNRVSVRSRGEPLKTLGIVMTEQKVIDNGKHPISALPRARCSPAADNGKRHASATSAITYPTPDASVQEEVEALGPSNDPTEEHIEFDTVLESEGFTMIDLESLPSARHFVTGSANNESIADLEQPGPAIHPVLAPSSSTKVPSSPTNMSKPIKRSPTPIPSYLAPPEEGESDLSSTVPSSPPIDLAQHTFLLRSNPLNRPLLHQAHTPLASVKSSPQLPPPPNQPQKAEQPVPGEDTKSTPPRLAQVVRAGIALQGLLSPKTRAPSQEPLPTSEVTDTGERSASNPKESLDELFVGFDSGTRRELRAGLRFGEELARRQELSSSESSSLDQGAMPVLNQENRKENDATRRQVTVVNHTPLRCDDHQTTRETPWEAENSPNSRDAPITPRAAAPFHANQSCGSIRLLDTEARERRWQLEREAISRQIEAANTSQVIVISDDEDEEETHGPDRRAFRALPNPAKSIFSEAEGDIWLAEAQDAQNPSRHMQRERGKELVSKPRRSLVPSPWKSGEDVDSTFMTDADESGMFWQQPKGKEIFTSFFRRQLNARSGEAPGRSFHIREMVSGSSVHGRQTSAIGKGIPRHALQETSDHGAEEPSHSQNETEAFEHAGDLADRKDLDAQIFEHGNDQAGEEDSAPGVDLNGDGEKTYQESFVQPQPTMVPVNFNDTTDLSILSEDRGRGITQLESPSSSPCRSGTPRSAMKGSRASLSIVDESAFATPRKVLFSGHSFCLDGNGMETSTQVRGDTPSPKRWIPSDHMSDSVVEASMLKTEQIVRGTNNIVQKGDTAASARKQIPSTSWLSKLTGWGSKPMPAACPAPAQLSSNGGHSNSNMHWEPTTTTLSSTSLAAFNALSVSSGFSSAASDPRFPPPPENLPVSGYFSDHHYKHMHILYLKSLKPTFTRPGSVRPDLKKCIGRKCYSGDGELAWEITMEDAEVVERWIRAFEGRDARECVLDWSDAEAKYRVIGWDEWDLCQRLFSIVAGQDVRREQKKRQKKDTGGMVKEVKT